MKKNTKKRSYNNNKNTNKKAKKSIFYYLFIMCLLSILIFGTFTFFIYIKLPNIDKNIDFRINNTNNNKIYLFDDKNLNIIKSYNILDKDDITYNELSPNLINALIATEDRRFFEHHGLDFLGIFRAFLINTREGKFVQGGSTITQQLAKSILKDNSKNFRRKFKELILTLRLEYIFSKEEILSMYLNMNYFGGGRVGIKSASEFYFSKLPSDLNIEESAILVGLLKAPGKFAPTVSQDMATRRALQVIINMQNAGYITPKDVLSYIIPNIQYSYKDINRTSQKYYFADWVRKKIYDFENESGKFDELNVVTTMDLKLQNIVEEQTYRFIDKYKNIIRDSQIAVIILNNNGEVLAMLGGKNYDQSAFNRSLYAYRQTGSLFKLFVYLVGFERGMQVNDLFTDEPIAVKDWYPENYEKKYYGNMTALEAFAKSSNSIAVQIAEHFGLNNIIDLARQMGISSKFQKNDLTITLGTTNINLIEITKAFAIVNNNGRDIALNSVKTIYNKKTNKLYEYKNINQQNIITYSSSQKMKGLLYNTILTGTGKAASVSSLINKTENYNKNNEFKKYFIGGKTGTTQNNRDAWFVGFANDLTIGIWMGNDDNTSTKNISGGNLPAKLWNSIVSKIVE